MPRYYWRACVYINAPDEQSAREAVDDAFYAINKNPDAPHMSLDDLAPEIEEED